MGKQRKINQRDINNTSIKYDLKTIDIINTLKIWVKMVTISKTIKLNF